MKKKVVIFVLLKNNYTFAHRFRGVLLYTLNKIQ